jgi:serine/threonine protein kinase
MLHGGEILEGRYQVLEEIGQGGTGIIFKAFHLTLQKYVVIKLVKENFVGSINERSEVDILKNLHHQYLPQVYDFIQSGQTVYTVIDFVDGYSLKEYLDVGNVFEEPILKQWLLELLDVLSYLHTRNPAIIHSDIKPANIMITPDGHICLIDFNVSLDGYDTNQIRGFSKRYAATEQIEMAELLARGYDYSHISLNEQTDIYSLGRTFQVMMSAGVSNGISYTDSLWTIISKATEAQKENRYKSAEKMKHQLLNMKKLDVRYRHNLLQNWLFHVAYGACVIVASLLIFYGYNVNTKQMFREETAELEALLESGTPTDIIDKGIEILNTKRFDKQETINPDRYEFVYQAIGYGYCDYAVESASDGDVTVAKETLANARDFLGNSPYIDIAEGEILAAEGEPAKALEKFERILERAEESGDKKIEVQALRKLCELHEKLGNGRELEKYYKALRDKE